MQDIYSNGDQCFVYLGEGINEADDFHLLEEWVRLCRQRKHPITLFIGTALNGGQKDALPGERQPWRSAIF